MDFVTSVTSTQAGQTARFGKTGAEQDRDAATNASDFEEEVAALGDPKDGRDADARAEAAQAERDSIKREISTGSGGDAVPHPDNRTQPGPDPAGAPKQTHAGQNSPDAVLGEAADGTDQPEPSDEARIAETSHRHTSQDFETDLESVGLADVIPASARDGPPVRPDSPASPASRQEPNQIGERTSRTGTLSTDGAAPDFGTTGRAAPSKGESTDLALGRSSSAPVPEIRSGAARTPLPGTSAAMTVAAISGSGTRSAGGAQGQPTAGQQAGPPAQTPDPAAGLTSGPASPTRTTGATQEAVVLPDARMPGRRDLDPGNSGSLSSDARTGGARQERRELSVAPNTLATQAREQHRETRTQGADATTSAPRVLNEPTPSAQSARANPSSIPPVAQQASVSFGAATAALFMPQGAISRDGSIESALLGADFATLDTVRTPVGGSGPGSVPLSEPRAVVRQIVDALISAHENGIELQLSPEELGRVKLSITPGETGFLVSVSADRPETLELLRRHIDLLGDEFASLGLGDTAFSFDESPGHAAQGGFEDAEIDQHSVAPIEVAEPGNVPSQRPMGRAGSGTLDIRL